MKKKSNITMLLKIAEEPSLSKTGRLIHFGDVSRGEHIVPIETIRLSTLFLKESPNPDEEPDDICYLVYTEGRTIRVTGCMWFELQDMLMKR